ncbi:MAG TPA: type II toxin-antitoxin system PemK/MazF family toxin [Gemmataceae bacterium]|nr:type II toxin-antitoxin system PemK/MazF family toxin [Gemmataceae bacterium]
MTQPLRCGQIVWAEVADENGVRKTRPVIIITPDDRLTAAEPLEVVAITSRLPQPLPADHVLLPWHAQGHPRTGLNRKCAAVCTWLTRIEREDILNIVGIVPGAILLDIARRIAGSRPGPSETPSSDEGSSET